MESNNNNNNNNNNFKNNINNNNNNNNNNNIKNNINNNNNNNNNSNEQGKNKLRLVVNKSCPTGTVSVVGELKVAGIKDIERLRLKASMKI